MRPVGPGRASSRGYRTLRVAVWRWLLLVGLQIFWAQGPTVGTGCAVGGPRAVRAATSDRRFGLLSNQAPPPTSAAAHVFRSSAFRSLRHLRTGEAFGADVARCVALMPSYGCQPAISHAIPLRLFQILTSQR